MNGDIICNIPNTLNEEKFLPSISQFFQTNQAPHYLKAITCFFIVDVVKRIYIYLFIITAWILVYCNSYVKRIFNFYEI